MKQPTPQASPAQEMVIAATERAQREHVAALMLQLAARRKDPYLITFKPAFNAG